MTANAPRLFASAAAIRRVGEGLLACTLPRPDWTHEAHLAATTWLVIERPDIDLDAELPGIIHRYNESAGGRNTAAEGYLEAITRVFLAAVRDHVAETDGGDLCACVNALLRSKRGQRDWPLRFYSRDRLFSGVARLSFVAPDLS
jgi:hypothetical protein